jgi:hypothetical protein
LTSLSIKQTPQHPPYASPNQSPKGKNICGDHSLIIELYSSPSSFAHLVSFDKNVLLSKQDEKMAMEIYSLFLFNSFLYKKQLHILEETDKGNDSWWRHLSRTAHPSRRNTD